MSEKCLDRIIEALFFECGLQRIMECILRCCKKNELFAYAEILEDAANKIASIG